MMLANLQAELAETLLSESARTDIVIPAAHLAIHRNNIIKHFTNTISFSAIDSIAFYNGDFVSIFTYFNC